MPKLVKVLKPEIPAVLKEKPEGMEISEAESSKIVIYDVKQSLDHDIKDSEQVPIPFLNQKASDNRHKNLINSAEPKKLLLFSDLPKRKRVSRYNSDQDLETGIGEQFLIGAGRSFVKLGQGVKQLYFGLGEKIGFVDYGTTAQYTNSINYEKSIYYNTPVGQSLIGMGTEFGVDLLSSVAMPGGAGLKGLKLISGAALSGGFIYGLQATEDGSFTSRAKNAAVGAAVGAGGVFIFQQASNVAGKAILYYRNAQQVTAGSFQRCNNIIRFEKLISGKSKDEAKIFIKNELKDIIPEEQFKKIFKTVKESSGIPGSTISIKKVLKNDNIRVILERPGAVEGFQRFSHEISFTGERVTIVQTAYNGLGNLVHQRPNSSKNNLFDIKLKL